MDLHGAYAKVTRARAPHAWVCADPFHIIKLANAAVDEVRRAAWNSTRRAAGGARPGPLARVRQDPAAQTIKHTRWAAEGPGRLDRQPARGHHQAAPRPPRPVPRLGAQGGAARPVPAPARRPPRRPPGRLAGPCRPLSYPGHAGPVTHHPPPPRPAPGRRPAGPVQQQARGTQLQDPADQPPRLRPPQRRRRHRHDLPLLLRPDHHAAHRKARRT
jgi:transposase